ncbi:ras-related protein rab-38 [Limosa lapponica baueri]|uniref:Ras-related protein rab-38 n=1 Tax=Limosa lapponica baueri TaxID=1758121 RepID=A0A2I0U0U1_LIMLA|nr:ras-related protein rab-38 [Limosa lapponica baueri]
MTGQERFGNMTRVYYREAMGAFIVFDVTRPATFEAVTKWKEDLDSKLVLPNGKPVPTVLLANKCDQGIDVLMNNGIKMDQFCKENGFVGWFETSAKKRSSFIPESNQTVKRRREEKRREEKRREEKRREEKRREEKRRRLNCSSHHNSCGENININEASRCLVKHIIDSESDPVQSVEPDIVKPHLNSSKIVSCSACFKS